MRDIELYARILGIKAPWFVDKVHLNVAEKRVDIWLDYHARSAAIYCIAGIM